MFISPFGAFGAGWQVSSTPRTAGRAGIARAGVDERRRAAIRGNGPAERGGGRHVTARHSSRGGSHLRNDPAASAGGQEGHQSELGDPKTTTGDRQDSQQPAPQQLQGDFHPPVSSSNTEPHGRTVAHPGTPHRVIFL
jgi:hypothetical protein